MTVAGLPQNVWEILPGLSLIVSDMLMLVHVHY